MSKYISTILVTALIHSFLVKYVGPELWTFTILIAGVWVAAVIKIKSRISKHYADPATKNTGTENS